MLLLAGAAGLVVGLWGVAATAALVAYFLLAIGAHVRAPDTANVPLPALYLALSAAEGCMRPPLARYRCPVVPWSGTAR